MTTATTALATNGQQSSSLRVVSRGFNDTERELLRNSIAVGASDVELAWAAEVCERLGLSPWLKQIYFLRLNVKDGDRYVDKLTPYVSVDGLRAVANRSGLYGGQQGPQWCGEDGVWRDVWLRNEPPAAARVGLVRRGSPVVTWSVATFREFARWGKNSKTGEKYLMGLWQEKPSHMLSIRAEVLALRRAFPEQVAELKDLDPEQGAEFAGQYDALLGEQVYEPPSLAVGAHVVEGESREVTVVDGRTTDTTSGEILDDPERTAVLEAWTAQLKRSEGLRIPPPAVTVEAAATSKLARWTEQLRGKLDAAEHEEITSTHPLIAAFEKLVGPAVEVEAEIPDLTLPATRLQVLDAIRTIEERTVRAQSNRAKVRRAAARPSPTPPPPAQHGEARTYEQLFPDDTGEDLPD